MKHLIKLVHTALILSLILAFGAALPVLAAPPAFVIDHFDSSTEVNTITWATPPGTPISASGASDDTAVLGGEREIEATVTGGINGEQLVVTTNNAGNSVANAAGGSSLVYTVDFLYDGKDNSGTPGVDAAAGLGGVDLTVDGANPQDEFYIGINSMDQVGTLSILVYSSATACSVVSLPAVGKVYDSSRKLVEIPFTDFSSMCPGASSNADFTSVNAVVLRVTASGGNAGLDINIHSFGTAQQAFVDTGDLPDTSTNASYKYNLVVDPFGVVGAETGPRHVIGGPQLGTTITAETAQQPSIPALLDSDDGIFTWGMWATGVNGGNVQVTVNGCTGTCYLNGFIDWNHDGKFYEGAPTNAYDDGEKIFTDRAVTNGTNVLIRFNIPAGTVLTSTEFYARFRLTSQSTNGFGSPWGDAFDGEVEDYLLAFNPNSVSLVQLSARPAGGILSLETLPTAVLPLAGLLVLALGLGSVVLLRRKVTSKI